MEMRDFNYTASFLWRDRTSKATQRPLVQKDKAHGSKADWPVKQKTCVSSAVLLLPFPRLNVPTWKQERPWLR